MTYTLTRRAFLAALGAFALSPWLRPRAAADTPQARIASFVALCKAGHYFAAEPSFLTHDSGKIMYVSPAGHANGVPIPDGVRGLSGNHLVIFHPPSIAGREAISPPAPEDIYTSALYGVKSVTAVGYDTQRGVGTLNVMTLTANYWPTAPLENEYNTARNTWTFWVDAANERVCTAAALDRGTWRARMNAALRAEYQVSVDKWGGLRYEVTDVG